MSEYVSAALDLDVTGPEHTRRLALTLADCLKAGDVLLLSGELGAGKTTFTRSLGEGLGCARVLSPRLCALARASEPAGGPRPGGPDLVHVDAYRLSSAEELDDLDLEFSLPRSVTVIEWGRDKAEHLSDSRLELDFTRLTGADARFAYSGAEEFSWDDEAEGATEEGAAGEVLEDLEADVPEPRLLRVRAFGPRWEHAFDALKEALQSV